MVLLAPGGTFRDLAERWGPASDKGRAGDQRWYPIPGPATVFLSLNRTAGPFRDAKIRRAFQLAIDRQAAAAAFGLTPIGRLIPPGIPSTGVDVVPLDGSGVEEARRLMAGRHVTVRYAYLKVCDACPTMVEALKPRLAHDGERRSCTVGKRQRSTVTKSWMCRRNSSVSQGASAWQA